MNASYSQTHKNRDRWSSLKAEPNDWKWTGAFKQQLSLKTAFLGLPFSTRLMSQNLNFILLSAQQILGREPVMNLEELITSRLLKQ